LEIWIYRAKNLPIISENTAARLFQQFRVNDWHRQEPGKPVGQAITGIPGSRITFLSLWLKILQ
jgi:hypothetical protein